MTPASRALLGLMSILGAVGTTSASTLPGGEHRGIWVTRWDYTTETQVRQIIACVAAAGFNHIYFQVRGQGDAYYESSIEPWGKTLTGTLGEDPGWDPLAVALDEAHKHDVTLHAWINVFAGWQGTTAPPRVEPRHWLEAHPEWQVRKADGAPGDPKRLGYTFMAPGNPYVREHIVNVVRDLLQRYDVPGLHLDYVRYPGAEFGSEFLTARGAASVAALGVQREDYLRAQVTTLVREVRATLDEVRPGAVLSAAVYGVYRNLEGWDATEAFGDCYQDSVAWAREGLVDVILPMMYWPREATASRPPYFDQALNSYLEWLPRGKVYPGIKHDYDITGEFEAQVALTRERKTGGFAVFSFQSFVTNLEECACASRLEP